MGENKEIVELKRTYTPGSQMWFPKGKFFDKDNNLRGFGCGVVACMDFCVYRGEIAPAKDRDGYCEAVRAMAHSFFPIMPGMGIAPYYYTALLNFFFIRKRLPYRVKRSFSGRKTEKVCDLLKRDLPVVICVGPTLPLFFKDKRIRLYQKDLRGGGFIPDRHSVSSHYMTVVGVERDAEGEVFFKIATWGELLYMKQSDYLAYTKYTFPRTNRFYEISVKGGG